MKKRILSLLLAVLMVATCVTIPAEAATTETYNKFELSLRSGVGEDADVDAVNVSVDNNYKATIKLDDHDLDPSYVDFNLKMKNVASLGVGPEGKEANFHLETDLTAANQKLTGQIEALKDFTNTNICGKINGYSFDYYVYGSYNEDSKNGKWVAEPHDVEETRAAWHELTSYVNTSTDEEDSKATIKKGAYIAMQNEYLSVDRDLLLNNLNNGSALEDEIRNCVSLNTEAELTSGIEVYLPAGTTLQVGSSIAELTEATRIQVNGLYYEDLSLEDLRDASGLKEMVLYAFEIVNETLLQAQGSSINVEITTESYEKYLEEQQKAEEEEEKKWEEFYAPVEKFEDVAYDISEIEIKADMSAKDFAAVKKSVEAARAAYNALTAEQKEEVGSSALVRLEKAELAIANIEIAAEKAKKEAELATLKAAAATQNEAAKKVLALTAKATAKVTVKTSGTKVTATWDAVEGAEKYAVIVVKNGKEEAPVMVTETTYEVSAPGTKVAIIVAPVATFENVEYTGKEVTSKSVVVKPARPTVKVNKSGKKFKVTVKKASVTGYQIQTAKNSKFTKNLKKYTVKGKKVSKSYKLTTLKKGTNYVRVRAYKTISGKKYYSSWSKAVKVKR